MRAGGHEYVGLGLSQQDPLERYSMRHVFDIGLLSAFKLLCIKYSLLIRDALKISSQPLTLKSVAKKYCLDCRVVPDVNSPAFHKILQELRVDVLVSSNGQIFKSEILSIPGLVCINRHTSPLPAHGGILPVFQGIAAGDEYTGVTAHLMDRAIDTGQIIVQRLFRIPQPPVLTDIYEACFKLSAEVIVEALDILERGLPFKPLAVPERNPSYHSFPTASDWKKFKANGGRFA